MKEQVTSFTTYKLSLSLSHTHTHTLSSLSTYRSKFWVKRIFAPANAERLTNKTTGSACWVCVKERERENMCFHLWEKRCSILSTFSPRCGCVTAWEGLPTDTSACPGMFHLGLDTSAPLHCKTCTTSIPNVCKHLLTLKSLGTHAHAHTLTHIKSL